MLGLKLNYVSKRGYWWQLPLWPILDYVFGGISQKAV